MRNEGKTGPEKLFVEAAKALVPDPASERASQVLDLIAERVCRAREGSPQAHARVSLLLTGTIYDDRAQTFLDHLFKSDATSEPKELVLLSFVKDGVPHTALLCTRSQEARHVRYTFTFLPSQNVPRRSNAKKNGQLGHSESRSHGDLVVQ